jgi:hypothetical protein
MRNLPVVFFLIIAFFSCTQPKKETSVPEENRTDDRSALLQSFLNGLWSLDSGNILTNDGFLITPDGNISFVASEITGTWQTPSLDSLVISLADSQQRTISYTIDSINENQMILSIGQKHFLYRKVPFGMDPQVTVLTGFSGTIFPGNRREYNVSFPSGKKVGLKLATKNPSLKFSLADDKKQLAENVQEWTGILVRGGDYKVLLNFPQSKVESAEFDLKVLSY